MSHQPCCLTCHRTLPPGPDGTIATCVRVCEECKRLGAKSTAEMVIVTGAALLREWAGELDRSGTRYASPEEWAKRLRSLAQHMERESVRDP